MEKHNFETDDLGLFTETSDSHRPGRKGNVVLNSGFEFGNSGQIDAMLFDPLIKRASR